MAFSTSVAAKKKRPSSWKVWFIAARPHTLTASIAPNIVSYPACVALLHDDASFDVPHLRQLMVQWTLFCMLMQLGTNLHNDYADFVKGADTDKRVGQPRATQQGWLSPSQTATAAGGVLLMGFFLGMGFLYQIRGTMYDDANGGGSECCQLSLPLAIMAFIVLSSIFNAFAYTGGPWPLGYIGLGNFSIGYSGLGDIFVFLYFGLVATMTLPFLYLTTTTPTRDFGSSMQSIVTKILPYAIPVAFLATNIIVVNNLRDRHTDVLANKRTLAVRLGATFCKREYLANVLVAYASVIWIAVVNDSAMFQLLPLVTLPMAMKEWKATCTKEGSALNPHVGGAAKVQFLFCILLAISLRISI